MSAEVNCSLVQKLSPSAEETTRQPTATATEQEPSYEGVINLSFDLYPVQNWMDVDDNISPGG